MKHLLKH